MTKSRAGDDRLALMAVIVGAALAFLERHQPLVLGTGAALGLAGVLLALRGDRPISGRSWLRAALALSALSVGAAIGIEHYQEWVVGQWFAEGTSGRSATDELLKMSRTISLLRVTGLGSSLAMLLGAMVSRMN